ncbi:MAG TPA: phosphoenolpyruvate--protein phosphotransferase [Fibrobacteraceae bacterium]|nr:phosphoenolpyruvate--protein phosphotransferase [Fibrobacteraceae bacterium]
MSPKAPPRPEYHLRIVKEVSEILSSPAETGSVLQSVVDYLARTLESDVVSIYLWDSRSGNLVMSANHGLCLDPANLPRLQPEEGLTGLVFERQQPISVSPASQHPRYKYFPSLGEQQFETFLGVPIMLRRRCLGVLNVQARQQQELSNTQEALLEVIAGRLAGLVDVAGRLDRVDLHKSGKGGPFRQGVGVSSGIAYGPMHKMEGLYKTLQGHSLTDHGTVVEQERIQKACAAVDKELADLLHTLMTDAKLSEAEMGIFKAQRVLLADPMFQEGLQTRVSSGNLSAEAVVQDAVEALCQQFSSLAGPAFFRERLYDLRDIEEKLLRWLMQERGELVAPAQVAPGSILLAHEVGPTHLFALSSLIRGVVTEVGGEGGHMAILARSLGIPAITGIEGLMDLVQNNDMLLVDGRTGFLFINPMEALVRDYDHYRKKQEEIRSHLREGGRTIEGAEVQVHVSANIGFPGDLRNAVDAGLQDVGLFRTEFSFMQRTSWPTIADQLVQIQEVVDAIPGWVTMRTLDIGSDKQLPYFAMPREENPMLGLRSVRFSMENTQVLSEQLRAILLAWKAGCKVKILIPMVTQLWEMDTVRQMLDAIATELEIPSDHRPPLGMMIEVPGVYWQLDDYLSRVDFLSFGTNDLVQYLLCVDRNSSHVGHLYCEHHPIVVRFLHDVQQKVAAAGKSVTVCGEMAGSPIGILILMALGYRQFSVFPQRAYVVRYIAKSLHLRDLEQIKESLLKAPTTHAIQSLLNQELQKIHPDLLALD